MPSSSSSRVSVKATIPMSPASILALPAIDAGTRTRRAAWLVLSVAIACAHSWPRLVPLTPDESYYWAVVAPSRGGVLRSSADDRIRRSARHHAARRHRARCAARLAARGLARVGRAHVDRGRDGRRSRATSRGRDPRLHAAHAALARHRDARSARCCSVWSLALAALVYALRDATSARTRMAGWVLAGLTLRRRTLDEVHGAVAHSLASRSRSSRSARCALTSRRRDRTSRSRSRSRCSHPISSGMRSTGG